MPVHAIVLLTLAELFVPVLDNPNHRLGAAPKWNQRPEGRKTQFRES